jgi:hypothetical protein
MRPLNRTCFAIAMIFVSASPLMAANHSPRPISLLPSTFWITVKTADSKMEEFAKASKPLKKICSCQILDLESKNYHEENVAVLAEQTIAGNPNANYSTTNKVIEKEKKHLKDFFYDKMQVVSRVSMTTDCATLYNKLKSSNRTLVLYDILDANAQK